MDVTIEKIQIGTYENPAKVGDIIRLESDYKVCGVSVNRYLRGNEANNIILIDKSDIKSGYEYLLAHVKVKYVSGEHTEYVSGDNFKVYCNGAIYRHECEYALNEMVFGGYIMPFYEERSEREGWILYEVPKNKDVLIEFTPPDGSSSCYIKLE